MKLPSSLITSAIALILATGILGCAKKPKTVRAGNRSAAVLLASGEDALKQGKWEEGRKLLRLIEEDMPSSPEFPKAKLLIGDSFFFADKASYPEAAVEYQNFLSYFPRHELRDYALYHIALCHYVTIPDAERDQDSTRLALTAFQNLLREAPGSHYAGEAKAKITQCWRRLAESELMVGIFYVKSRQFAAAETRLKGMLETYPEYADRERAYYYLGSSLRQKNIDSITTERLEKDFRRKIGKDSYAKLTNAEEKQFKSELEAYRAEEMTKYRQEAREYFQRLVESYPKSRWTKLAKHELSEMGKNKG